MISYKEANFMEVFMIHSLEEKLISKSLTKIEKLIANFFYHNENRLYFLTSTEIGEELKISDTSVIRFVKKLGYSSFKEFKNDIRRQVSEKILTPTVKLSLNEEMLKNNNLVDIFLESINKNIEKTLNINNLEKIEKAISLILKSRKKFVVGFKSTSGVASFFGLRLGFVLENVKTYSLNNSELIKDIIDIKKGDCLFLIAHPKYSKTYQLLIEQAKTMEASIIIVTDRAVSPVANLGDVTLLTEVGGLSYFNSIVPTQSLLEFILTFISRGLDENSKNRLISINKFLNQNTK